MPGKNTDKTVTCDEKVTRFDLQEDLAELLKCVVKTNNSQNRTMRDQLKSYAQA